MKAWDRRYVNNIRRTVETVDYLSCAVKIFGLGCEQESPLWFLERRATCTDELLRIGDIRTVRRIRSCLSRYPRPVARAYIRFAYGKYADDWRPKNIQK